MKGRVDDKTCPEYTRGDGRGLGSRCGRPIKEEGLCGIHLAAQRKIEANDAARKQAEADRNARYEALKVQCERLEVLTGVEAHASYGGQSVSLGVDQFDALLTWAESQ